MQVIASDARRGAELEAIGLRQAISDHGWSTEIVALAPSDDSTTNLSVPVLGRRRLRATTLTRLRSRARQADVIVAHGSTTLPACAVALLGVGKPFVYRNIGDPTYWAPFGSRKTRTAMFLRRAAFVAAVSQATAVTLREHLGVEAARVGVIPNGRSAERFHPPSVAERLAARREFGDPTDTQVVVYLGSLTAEKRVDIAIAAVAALTKTQLLIAGDGPEAARLRALADTQPRGSVRFLGPVQYPEKLLAAADAVILTSSSEGVPGALIEAGLSGLPVVASDVGGVRDVVIDGVTGILVDPSDIGRFTVALRDALESRDQLGRAARRHCVKIFDVARVASQWDRMLRSVMASTA